MANVAQCYYCFECLSASFEDRDPPNLAAVEALWEQHEQSKKLSFLRDQAEAETASGREEEEEDDDDDEENEDGNPFSQQQPVNGDKGSSGREDALAKISRPKGLKLPSVSRLRSQISSDASSTATTPSTTSTSSNSVLSSSTNVTTPSAQSDTPASHQQKSLERRHPLFVTWNILSRSGHKSLRGCIGTFEAQELAAGLKSYALTSAFDDTRFSPIPRALIPSLSCSLTLLSSFEPCTNAMDWILGTHGLRISFIHRGRRYGATYLPDVPVEQGWSKEETVESLMRKAGWDGGAGSVARRLLRGAGASTAGATKQPWEQVSDFRAVKYQGLKASATYAQWQTWREWVLSLDDGPEKLGC